MPKKADKVIVGATFEPKYWTGSYALHDDGRRTGKLVDGPVSADVPAYEVKVERDTVYARR